MPSSSRASHYQRFIPREEVELAETWEFGPVDSAQHAAQAAQAAADAGTLSAEQAQALRQQAEAEGFERGHEAGMQAAHAALEQQYAQRLHEQTQRIERALEQAQAGFDRLEQHLADQLLELACDLARQVVRRELQAPLEPLRAVVHEALALALQDGRPATLRLHPDDAALLQASGDWAPGGHPLNLRPDAQLQPGDCVVESAQGSVDARLEKRWARAVANLGLQTPWQPGSDADV